VVKSRWNDDEAAAWGDDLGLCVYASRLLGADSTLVLSGGGNSSVKTAERDVFGDEVEVLHVKGSGWNMGSIERAGFAPLRLDPVARLATLPELSDARMANELRAASLDASAPAPSVESILHATLPYRFVLHTHADAVLALTNTPGGEALVREVYGDEVVVVPYVMPGFVLARLCAERFPAERHAGTVGMVLLNHGLFTFADDARTAYETHVDLVARALVRVEAASAASTANGTGTTAPRPAADPPDDRGPAAMRAIAELRLAISSAAGHPMILRRSTGEAARRYAARDDLEAVGQVGPATPDHVLRTKRIPLLGRNVTAYVAAYREYVDRHRDRLGDRALVPVDPAPRVVVDPALGVLAAGRRVGDADAAREITEHTMWVVERAAALGGYRTPGEADIFDVEYWELEQAKLRLAGEPAEFTGEVALVTGAASGIGRACADALRARGAAVVGVDLNPRVTGDGADDYLGVEADVTDPAAVDAAIERATERFGGVDIVVAAAGIFPRSRALADLDPAAWRRTMAVNVDSIAYLFSRLHPLLALAPRGGRAVLIASKNAPAPGPGAAPYSASKAAAVQLARVAALEWAADGIRVNIVHPDAVFDTGLWTAELLEERARRYGMGVEEYKRRNLLGVEITSAQVGALAAALCSDVFAATTGAQVPIDGGNERVI
jgi:rhamnose utilization protein RhaD (predicted bifunctional aldolase and dehydrogenase)/NAD(P)-dependent dehydrogenase (short-subunit alcohol dehydrogenase family)